MINELVHLKCFLDKQAVRPNPKPFFFFLFIHSEQGPPQPDSLTHSLIKVGSE